MKIIQHLGQFVRYEVELPQTISTSIFEIDMPLLVPDIREHDEVFVTVKEGVSSLFTREETNE